MTNIKNAVYYYYEGESLIITRDRSGGGNNIEIESYRSMGNKDDGISLVMMMTQDDWSELVKKVEALN